MHLWYSVPIVEMYHPGHGHIPVRSECHTTDPGMTELWLFTSDLEAAGAQANDHAELLITTLPWEPETRNAERFDSSGSRGTPGDRVRRVTTLRIAVVAETPAPDLRFL